MKTLSIQQPWAELIVRGMKDVENRTWKTTYRGPLLIHASKRIEHTNARDLIFGVDAKLDRGGIVGMVDLVDCVLDADSLWATDGGHHWVLANPRRCVFTPSRGRLGLYETPHPPALCEGGGMPVGPRADLAIALMTGGEVTDAMRSL